jgi:hypothetical protein
MGTMSRSFVQPSTAAPSGALGGYAVCEQECLDDAYIGDYSYSYTADAVLLTAGPYLGLRASEVRSAVREVLDGIREAYSSFASGNTDEDGTFPAGVMVLSLEVDAGGRVTDVTLVSDGVGSATLARTVAGILRGVDLPEPPEGGGVISVSIDFRMI